MNPYSRRRNSTPYMDRLMGRQAEAPAGPPALPAGSYRARLRDRVAQAEAASEGRWDPEMSSSVQLQRALAQHRLPEDMLHELMHLHALGATIPEIVALVDHSHDHASYSQGYAAIEARLEGPRQNAGRPKIARCVLIQQPKKKWLGGIEMTDGTRYTRVWPSQSEAHEWIASKGDIHGYASRHASAPRVIRLSHTRWKEDAGWDDSRHNRGLAEEPGFFEGIAASHRTSKLKRQAERLASAEEPGVPHRWHPELSGGGRGEHERYSPTFQRHFDALRARSNRGVSDVDSMVDALIAERSDGSFMARAFFESGRHLSRILGSYQEAVHWIEDKRHGLSARGGQSALRHNARRNASFQRVPPQEVFRLAGDTRAFEAIKRGQPLRVGQDEIAWDGVSYVKRRRNRRRNTGLPICPDCAGDFGADDGCPTCG